MNETGYMHNRIRMITASFLTKNLLIDWRWGEVYFASMLLDLELSSNNGSWQWVTETGADAAPYFRIFNPTLQTQKFDNNKEYIKKWVTEYNSKTYNQPIIDFYESKLRAIRTYQKAILHYKTLTK